MRVFLFLASFVIILSASAQVKRNYAVDVNMFGTHGQDIGSLLVSHPQKNERALFLMTNKELYAAKLDSVFDRDREMYVNLRRYPNGFKLENAVAVDSMYSLLMYNYRQKNFGFVEVNFEDDFYETYKKIGFKLEANEYYLGNATHDRSFVIFTYHGWRNRLRIYKLQTDGSREVFEFDPDPLYVGLLDRLRYTKENWERWVVLDGKTHPTLNHGFSYRKIFVEGDEVIFMVDHPVLKSIHTLTFNLNDRSTTPRYLPKPVIHGQQHYHASSAWYHNQQVYSVATRNHRLAFTVYHLPTGEVQMQEMIDKTQAFPFLNGPIMDMDTHSPRRAHAATRKFVRRLTTMNAGLVVLPRINANTVEVTLGMFNPSYNNPHGKMQRGENPDAGVYKHPYGVQDTVYRVDNQLFFYLNRGDLSKVDVYEKNSYQQKIARYFGDWDPHFGDFIIREEDLLLTGYYLYDRKMYVIEEIKGL